MYLYPQSCVIITYDLSYDANKINYLERASTLVLTAFLKSLIV